MRRTAGIGFKPAHFEEAIACPAAGLWFEVHAENYMVAGGPRLAMLEALRAERPLSLHGVGLSIAGAERIDRTHLERLSRLVDRVDPFMVSEHLAWSRIGQFHLPDLLPIPRTTEALHCIVRNIDETQETLGRRILIENPSHYAPLPGHEWDEPAFLSEVARRAGCGLLIDVNNVWVSANNLGYSPQRYIDALPWRAIEEIHIAGHRPDAVLGDALLIDSHDAPVAEAVWNLLERLISIVGDVPVLLERDGKIPPFSELLAERNRAATCLADCREFAHAY
ncbi:DUF692 domain-containing protein [Methylocystis sp. 9N]|uniref:DUF692 domain-containing protein n=1 Tax=Methylocystis borbori TaxID=3118750 RepID=A0ABU7XC88_9HYPH